MALFFTLMATPASCAERFAISLGKTPFSNGERVVGFEVKVVSGGICSLASVPIGWYITIDNDPSYMTKITGSVLVGAAALDPNELQHIIIVEKNEIMDIKFDVKIKVIVTKDFDKTRTVSLRMKDLELARQ